jgi:hypothetical protein
MPDSQCSERGPADRKKIMQVVLEVLLVAIMMVIIFSTQYIFCVSCSNGLVRVTAEGFGWVG